VSIKITAFWNIVPCSLVEVDQLFRGAEVLCENNLLSWIRYSDLFCLRIILRLEVEVPWIDPSDLPISLQLLCFPLQPSSHSIHRNVDGDTCTSEKLLGLADTDWTEPQGNTKVGIEGEASSTVIPTIHPQDFFPWP
jgi:hypothetical protein